MFIFFIVSLYYILPCFQMETWSFFKKYNIYQFFLHLIDNKQTSSAIIKIKKDVLPSHHHSNVIYYFVCHYDSRYVGRTSQRLEKRIKQHVSRSIANPPASPNRQSLSRSCNTHNNFTNPPLVNIFLTTPNALYATATKNFLFSLEVALPFTFLLLKRLSLNLSIPFCVIKKNSSTL